MNTEIPTNTAAENMFLIDGLPALFAKTATPIILIMAANGLFTLVDAYYLGAYVGADALTATVLLWARKSKGAALHHRVKQQFLLE